MSFVDFNQTAEDHCHLIVLVKQVGCHLKPKSLNFVYECISRVKVHQIPNQDRKVCFRYLRHYRLDNSEWGDFQAHRKVLGLICVGKCNNENEVSELYKLHEDLKDQYGGTLFDSRLILLGLKQDGSALEKRLRRESQSEKERARVSNSSSNESSPMSGDVPNSEDKENSNHSSQTESSAGVKTTSSTHVGGSQSITSLQTSSTESTDSTYFSDPLNVNAPVSPAAEQPSVRTESESSVEEDGMASNGTSLLPKEGVTSHVLCYPSEEDCAGDLEQRMQEFASSLFWVLESKRLDRRSLERQDRMALLTAPFEKKDMVGVDTDTRMYKKRCQGRLRKYLGDLCLLAGVPAEAMAHYQTSIDILRSATDWLWLGAAYEGICSATVIMARPPVVEPPKMSFQRNQSFSIKRGSSAMKEANKNKSSTLGKNISNGLDLSDTRSSQSVLPEDIIEKYKEAVQHYGRFRNAGIIEMEASLKACRILITQQKYLAAADFLQNVVYINIHLTDEEKTQRFAVLASLYSELGMHRKAGFFKRICAMQSVAPACPKPAWPHCYRTLLQALRCYNLSLDPKEKIEGHGWPLVQLRVLHELIYSARRMGNPAIAIRHLTYLLHAMFEHLAETDVRELASVLESYTARCEGTPQALALDDGTILPPVPLLKFPTVKTFRLLDLPPHLRPMKFSKSQTAVAKVKAMDSPFIYSPLQIFKTNVDKSAQTKMDFCWVQGDVCETSIQVSNPLPFELHCSNLGLLSEGLQFESYPSSLSLPAESGPFHVKMTGVPKQAGTLTVQGYTTKVLGVRSHCRLRDMPHIPQTKFEIEIVPALPQLSVATSLPKAELFSSMDDSDSVVTSAYASLYAGQSCECQLRLTSVGKLNVERVDLLFDSKLDQGIVKKVIEWNPENLTSQLPLAPDSQGSLIIYLHGIAEFVIWDKLRLPANDGGMSGSASSSSQWTTNMTDMGPYAGAMAPTGEHGDGSWTMEALMKLQYSGGPGLQSEYCRQCSVALTLEVKASLRIHAWDVHQSPSEDRCVLVLDLENVSSHEVQVTYTDCDEQAPEPLVIHSHRINRLGVEIPKCNIPSSTAENIQTSTDDLEDVLSSGVTNSDGHNASSHKVLNASTMDSCHNIPGHHKDQELQKRITSHVCDFVDIRWNMVSEKHSGHLSLESLWWTVPQLALLQKSPIVWAVRTNEEIHEAGQTLACRVAQPVLIHTSITPSTMLHDACLHLEVQPDIDHVGHTNTMAVMCGQEQSGAFSFLGVPTSHTQACVAEGSVLEHSCAVMFLCAGTYNIDIVCTGHTLSACSDDQSHPDLGSECNTEWRYIPSLKISIVEGDDNLL